LEKKKHVIVIHQTRQVIQLFKDKRKSRKKRGPWGRAFSFYLENDTIYDNILSMNTEHTILLFYKYTPIENPEHLAMWHRGFCVAKDFKGRVIIAKEGINCTLEGKTEDVKQYVETITKLHISPDTRGMGCFKDVKFKTSPGTGVAFPKMKIKVRDEIVSVRLGDEDVNPNAITGKHLPPEELKRWYKENEEFYIVDMRNSYEFKVCLLYTSDAADDM
jgi:predicted sulfurtransferase